YLGLLPLLLAAVAVVALPSRALLCSAGGRVVALFALASAALAAIQFGWEPALRLVAAAPPLSYFVLNRVVGLLPFAVGLVAAASYARLPAADGRTRALRSAAVGAATLAVGGWVLWAGRGQLAHPGPDRFAGQDVALALALTGL